MFDHVTLTVSKLARSVSFYEATLKPLGIKARMSFPGFPGHAPLEGFGSSDERYLLLKKGKPDAAAVHLAFRAKSKKMVGAFYEAAIAAGARDNGKPGPRPKYFPEYYAAYVLDPDGYNIEAVFLR
jgi:catechol 2,3-dioxygenase-like lactoylglutathione lyase family enzyme